MSTDPENTLEFPYKKGEFKGEVKHTDLWGIGGSSRERILEEFREYLERNEAGKRFLKFFDCDWDDAPEEGADK